jgi:hypothetical protein
MPGMPGPGLFLEFYPALGVAERAQCSVLTLSQVQWTLIFHVLTCLSPLLSWDSGISI